MEDRILFDAVPDGDMAQAMSEAAVEELFAPEMEADADAGEMATVSDADQHSSVSTRRELVLVDTSVENFQQLVGDILSENDPGRDIEVVTIDSSVDGVQAISEILAGYSGLDAVHLVSHGTDSAVKLGSVWLSASNLYSYAGEIAQWASAFSSDGDLLLYGCHLGDSADGRQLVESISALTETDVAASVDATGHESRGGDWQLEFAAGSIEAGVVVSPAVQQNWHGLLAADGDLQVELIAAPNYVVDSNDPTEGPSSAYIQTVITNTGTDTLTDVFAYIGDYVDGVSDTPGLYPARTHTGLTGTFSLTHEGGSAGSADATRYIGELAPGESVTQYWLVSYPKVDDNGDSVVGGAKPDDDLFVNYDVWATANDPVDGDLTATEAGTANMRSEISASANKIWPNSDNKVPDEYKQSINELLGWDAFTDDGDQTAYPGETLTAKGIWYDLGNVNKGFDNDGDFVPDQNAFLQPVGDAANFDVGKFRLVHTYGMVLVKLKEGGEQLIPFEDQLYFTNIPDNTGAVGLVFYEFAALDGATSDTAWIR